MQICLIQCSPRRAWDSNGSQEALPHLAPEHFHLAIDGRPSRAGRCVFRGLRPSPTLDRTALQPTARKSGLFCNWLTIGPCVTCSHESCYVHRGLPLVNPESSAGSAERPIRLFVLNSYGSWPGGLRCRPTRALHRAGGRPNRSTRQNGQCRSPNARVRQGRPWWR